jgi:HD-GYP domain-containing protein (c-di-GMP phosphodiesterase class II)
MKRRIISLGGFFTAILLFFLVVILVEGGLTAFFRINSRLQEFTNRGETFTRVGSHLLAEQVRRGEMSVRALVRGWSSPARENRVLLAALVENNTITSVLKGWFPEGMVLPPGILSPEWQMNDLLDQFGRNLLTGTMTVDGKTVFAAMDLDLNELNVAGTPGILPVLSTSTGSVVWTGSAQEASGLAAHIGARGLVARKERAEGAWTLHSSHYGERVVLRQEPFLYGLRLSLLYPLPNLLRSAMYGAASSGSATVAALLALFLIWFVWRRGIYSSISEIASLSEDMSDRLADLEGGDHIRAAEAMYSLARRFAGLKETFVLEMNVFTANLRNLFQVISQQQEELTAFNEETEAMNQELENVNNRLVMREALWERTLEFSHTFARSEDSHQAISSTLHTIRRDVGAFGVLLSAVEGDHYRLTASSGYNGELAPFTIPKNGIAATESVLTGAPLWVENIALYPSARPVHPSVKSELLVPLFQSGEEEGVLEIAFDRITKKDPFLIETLVPVASYLGGLVHGEKMRREVEASYSYLAEKLQFVTGIYHDETENHIARIGEYCRLLAGELGRSHAEQEKIALFARLHDIGKLKVPREILSKPDVLTPEEFGVIAGHPAWGAEILGDAAWLAMARRICLTHHEKWDGSGYPRGLKGRQIPWEGQVTALADIYDALRSSRAYKPPFTHEEAVDIITRGDGRVEPGHFSPEVLSAFTRRSATFEEIYETMKDKEFSQKDREMSPDRS